MSNRLAIFDCDGTLVDSGAAICAALAGGFAACGVALPPEKAQRDIIGLSVVEAMSVLHPAGDKATHRALADAYKAAFFDLRQAGHAHEPLYAGIVAAIDLLDARGWLLGVATGKSDRGLAAVLAKHGLSDRFVTLQTADRHPSKPHPSMIEQAMADAGAVAETTVMIGDTSYDMAMARNAGCRAIGVAWGYHQARALQDAGAHAVATHADELVALIEAQP